MRPFYITLIFLSFSVKILGQSPQQLDSIVGQFWNDSSSSWVSVAMEEYSYDNTGKMTLAINWVSDPLTGNVAPESRKIETSFNNNDYLILETNYAWNTTTSQWVNYWKTEKSYDANGFMNLIIDYKWNIDSSKWLNNQKHEITYDNDGRITSSIKYSPEFSNNNIWITSYNYEHFYDSDGNDTLITSESLIDTTWYNISKNVRTFDVNGNLLSETEYSWNGSQWTKNWWSVFNIGQNSNWTSRIDYKWDSDSVDWVEMEKEDRSFDFTVNSSELFLPYASEMIYLELPMNDLVYSKPTEGLKYEYLDGNWNPYLKLSFYYSEWMGVSNDVTASCAVFPNPTTDYLNFKLPHHLNSIKVRIIDSYGREVVNQIIFNMEKIHIGHLPKGIYFYELTSDETTNTGKVIFK